MLEIKDLLVKFNKILLSETVKIQAIQDVLKKTIKLDIKSEDIKIKNNTVYLNIKPIYKNEIFLHKEKINFLLEDILGKRAPTHIR